MKRSFILLLTMFALTGIGLSPASATSTIEVTAPATSPVGSHATITVNVSTDEPLVGRTDLAVFNTATGDWDTVTTVTTDDRTVLLTSSELRAGENLFRVTYSNFTQTTQTVTVTGTTPDPDPEPESGGTGTSHTHVWTPHKVIAGQHFPILVAWSDARHRGVTNEATLQVRTGNGNWTEVKTAKVNRGLGLVMTSQSQDASYRVVTAATTTLKATISNTVKVQVVKSGRH